MNEEDANLNMVDLRVLFPLSLSLSLSLSHVNEMCKIIKMIE